MLKFSVSDRHALIQSLQSEFYDLLIIGGGITGAGIALDAASRGLKTVLVEKKDFAYGTSSRSTKLIHGGLRYLKQLEFGLVKEVGSERAIVHRLAPHLVVPEKMLLPLSEKRGLGYWLTSIGLMIYDYLAGVKPADQRRMLTKKQTLRYEPLLRADDIKGGAVYAEYRTDDARLTIEIMKSAFKNKANALNYLEVIDFLYEQNVLIGARVKDKFSGDEFEVRSKVIVNAGGPWVDNLRAINQSKTGKRLHLTKGVHVVVPRYKLPVKQSIYFDVDDGRMIFAIPRGTITYIGTTDTNYQGSPDEVVATSEDAAYLINAVNATFPEANLKLTDITSSWAGLRPLIHEEGKSASQLSRKDEIFESPTGLISIAGGKLTGYRKMAERVVNLVIKKHFNNRKFPKCSTASILLPGAEFKGKKAIRKYTITIQKKLKQHQITEQSAKYLVETYGRQTDTIIQLFENIIEPLDAELKLLKAQLMFSVNNEMVLTLSDFFVRRTGLLYFDIEKVLLYKSHVAIFLKEMLKWDDNRLKQEIEDVETLIRQARDFNPHK
jgi:glycerol-3-phosphate dehydrogenase